MQSMTRRLDPAGTTHESVALFDTSLSLDATTSFDTALNAAVDPRVIFSVRYLATLRRSLVTFIHIVSAQRLRQPKCQHTLCFTSRSPPLPERIAR